MEKGMGNLLRHETYPTYGNNKGQHALDQSMITCFLECNEKCELICFTFLANNVKHYRELRLSLVNHG